MENGSWSDLADKIGTSCTRVVLWSLQNWHVKSKKKCWTDHMLGFHSRPPPHQRGTKWVPRGNLWLSQRKFERIHYTKQYPMIPETSQDFAWMMVFLGLKAAKHMNVELLQTWGTLGFEPAKLPSKNHRFMMISDDQGMWFTTLLQGLISPVFPCLLVHRSIYHHFSMCLVVFKDVFLPWFEFEDRVRSRMVHHRLPIQQVVLLDHWSFQIFHGAI